jgi:ribosomal-protein-serine acetyltransferase
MKLLIVNDDITLRELYEKDAEQLLQLTDNNRAYLRAWLPWLDHNQAPEDTIRFIQNARQSSHENVSTQFGIWYRGELAGVIGYHHIDIANRSASIGYWVAENRQGKGIIHRSVVKIMEGPFVNGFLNRIEIRCAVENKKSRAIPERLGFTFEGILRQAEFCYDHYSDMAVYSLVAQDYKKTI